MGAEIPKRRPTEKGRCRFNSGLGFVFVVVSVFNPKHFYLFYSKKRPWPFYLENVITENRLSILDFHVWKRIIKLYVLIYSA